MPYTDLNLGKVQSGYMAHCWFGRPLALSDNAVMIERIGSELSLGCDGFVFRLTERLDTLLFKKQMVLLEEILQTYSQRAFLCLELSTDGIEVATLEIMHKYTFPNGYLIASKVPNTLIKLWQLDPSPSLYIGLIVESEKGFSGLDHCPYNTVMIAENVASHERILKIHKSAKEVFVRAYAGKRAKGGDEKRAKRIEKRLQWLIKAGVDAIITNQTKKLTQMMDLCRE